MPFASNDAVKTMKRIRPLVPIADIACTENRFPVRRTTGVRPCSPPGAAGDLVRADPDLVGEEEFAALRLRSDEDRRPGLLMSAADRFRVLLNGPLVRSLEGRSPPLEVRARPGLGAADPGQLEDQFVDRSPRPQLAGKAPAGRGVIGDGLPDGGLLGLGQNLMLARPAVPRSGRQCVPATGLPPRPPGVHGPDRHLEQGRGIYPVPALHQRGRCRQPHGLLRVR